MLHWSKLARFGPVLLDLDGVVTDLEYFCIRKKNKKIGFLGRFQPPV
jgi:hypothetical protein